MSSITEPVLVYRKISTKDKYTLRKVKRKDQGFVTLDGPGMTVRLIEMSVFKSKYKEMRPSKKPHPKGCGFHIIFVELCKCLAHSLNALRELLLKEVPSAHLPVALLTLS